jgi:hypothetical protein
MHNLGYHADALARLGTLPNSARLPLIEPIPNGTQHNKRLRKKVALAFTEDVPPVLSIDISNRSPSPNSGVNINSDCQYTPMDPRQMLSLASSIRLYRCEATPIIWCSGLSLCIPVWRSGRSNTCWLRKRTIHVSHSPFLLWRLPTNSPMACQSIGVIIYQQRMREGAIYP